MNPGLIDTSALPALDLLRKVLSRKIKLLIDFKITVTFENGKKHVFNMLFKNSSDAYDWTSRVYGVRNKIEVNPLWTCVN